MTYLSLIPIVLGVGIATCGDESFTTIGFLHDISWCNPRIDQSQLSICYQPKLFSLADLPQTIVTNRMMTGNLKLMPVEFLLRMSPLACLQTLIYSVWSGEVSRALSDFGTSADPAPMATTRTAGLVMLMFLEDGFLAFCLNVSSFTTNKLVGALTMTVCANVKQCFTIVLGIFLFHAQVGFTNATGFSLTVFGITIFSFVELRAKNSQRTRTQQDSRV